MRDAAVEREDAERIPFDRLVIARHAAPPSRAGGPTSRAEFAGDGRVSAVRTASGRILEADLAVIGIGVVPASTSPTA